MKNLDLESVKKVREDSDVDIAVFWKDEKMDFTSKLSFTNELQDRFGRDVDLIGLNDIDVIYGMQVMEKGRILINHNPGLLLSWQSEQLSRYPDFKSSREVIEKNILNRKRYV